MSSSRQMRPSQSTSNILNISFRLISSASVSVVEGNSAAADPPPDGGSLPELVVIAPSTLEEVGGRFEKTPCQREWSAWRHSAISRASSVQ